MKKQVLITCLALGIGTSALAQQPAASAAVVATPSKVTYTHADTVQAVRQLFHKRRTGGWVWTTIGFLTIVRVGSASADSDTGGNTAGKVMSVGVVGGVPTAIGISKLVRFNHEKETAVLSIYEQSKLLPPYVSRRLKKKYFVL